jgi:hypothetical protein
VFTFGDDYPDSVAPHIDSSEQLLHLDDKKVSQEDVDDFIAKHYFHTIFQKNPYWVTLDFENEDDIRQLFGVLEDVYKNISRNV